MAAFMVVSAAGTPCYELDLAARRPGEDGLRAAQFILHAALDSVDAAVWNTKESYLKVVDRHGDQLVSAYVTAGGLRLMLVHEPRIGDNALVAFFQEVQELLVKVCLNPFYTPGARILAKDFDTRVKAVARRHVGYRGD
jgi:hypothetical protein